MTIKFIPHEEETYDIMNCRRMEAKIHEQGMVALVDVMPRQAPAGQSCDYAVVQAARVSYGQGTTKRSNDEGLIRYLMANRHTTPFEMVELKFHVRAPIAVCRQWIRHRTASVNEMSGRYSILPGDFYRPSEVRGQSKTNKQGSEGLVDAATADEFNAYLDASEALYQRYEALVEKGVTREQARIGLPVSIYTEWYWKIDLHNLFHFLSLRMDPHAQQEIRDYANVMFDMVKVVAPWSCQAFLDYRMNSVTLSHEEIECLMDHMDDVSISTNDFKGTKREKAAFHKKLDKMGFCDTEEE